jgi:hypothetical protein
MTRVFRSSAMLFILLSAMTIGDLPWQESFGTLTRCPIIFLSPIVVFVVFCLNKKPLLTSTEKYFLGYWIMSSIWAIMMLIAYLMGDGAVDFQGQNLVIRLVKTCIENLIFFFVVVSVGHLLRRLNLKIIWWITLTIFLGLLLAGFIEIHNKETLAFLHPATSSAISDERISLLASEPSQAFPILAGFYFSALCLAVVLGKDIKWLLSISIILLFFALQIGSKGGIPILAVSLALPILGVFRNRPRMALRLSVFIAPGIIVMLVLAIAAQANIQYQFAQFNTFGSRITGMCSPILSLIHFPLGVGYGTFPVYFPRILYETGVWIQNLFSIPINMSEILEITQTGKMLSAKAGIPTQIVYNGVLAIGFFFLVFRQAFMRIKTFEANRPLLSYLFQAFTIFMLMTITFAADMDTLYVYLLPILIVERISLPPKPIS